MPGQIVASWEPNKEKHTLNRGTREGLEESEIALAKQVMFQKEFKYRQLQRQKGQMVWKAGFGSEATTE